MIISNSIFSEEIFLIAFELVDRMIMMKNIYLTQNFNAKFGKIQVHLA